MRALKITRDIGKTPGDERPWDRGKRFVEQLKVGGRLVMPLGPADAPQQLTVIEKIAPSETRMRSIILVNFVPFTGSRD